MNNPPNIDFVNPAGPQMPAGMYVVVVDQMNTPVWQEEIRLLVGGGFMGARFCPGCDLQTIRAHVDSFTGCAFAADMNVVHYAGHHVILVGPVGVNELTPISDWVAERGCQAEVVYTKG